MAVFNPIVITTAGISLLSQAMAGKGTLTFTSVATSTTVIPYNISNIQAMTALSGIMQTVVPVSAVLKTGNVQVSSIFSNSGVTNAYTANTIGLYAALGNGAQTLFAVAIATTPDNIPVQNDLSPSNFYYQFNIAISDTSQLTVTVPEDGSLPASVFNQMFPGITAPDQNNDGDALVYNASSGAWGYVNTETVFTTVSGSGEFVSLQKTLADDFKQIQLFGKSVQKPTTGAQLFNINKLKELDDGVEIIDYSTGEMEITQQNNAMLSVRLSDICPNMVAGQTYYLTGETTSNNKYLRVGAKQWNFDEAFVPKESDLLAQCNFKCTTQTGQSGEIIYYKDTFKYIMIVEGTTEKPYEVYTGGEAATEPTPEFPLPITSAGNYDAEEEKYEVGIGVTGKNLFDASKVQTKTQGGATITNNGDGSFTISGSGSLTESTSNNYSISHNDMVRFFKVGTVKMYTEMITHPYFYVNLNKGKEFVKTLISSSTGATGQFEMEKEYFKDEAYRLILGINGNNNATIVPGTIKPVLYQEGDSTWEPFKQQLTTLQLPNPLRGIPVDSGGNYTDADGQQWICDYIDRERGKYVQVVGIEQIKSFNFVETPDAPGRYLKGVIKTYKQGNIKSLFNIATFAPWGTVSKIKWTASLSARNLYISPINNGSINTAEELNNFLTDLGYPVVAVGVLDIPIETDLTPDQLAALNLSTYQGITNIGTDAMPQVGVAVESRGFNLASDLAQNLIDLQNTVQIQGTTVSNLNSFINRPGRIANGVPIVNESNTCLMYKAIADIVYPVGSIYLSVNNINPGTLFGGTWVAWGSGQVPVGVNTSITQFATVEQTGGEIEHTLILDEIPAHDHLDVATGGGVDAYPVKPYRWDDGGGLLQGPASGIVSSGYQVATTNPIVSNGGGEAHNNLQPYITCYMWKRTA